MKIFKGGPVTRRHPPRRAVYSPVDVCQTVPGMAALGEASYSASPRCEKGFISVIQRAKKIIFHGAFSLLIAATAQNDMSAA
jgi:hypothetical protein